MFIFVSVLSHFLGLFGSAYLNITGGGSRVLFLHRPIHNYSFREALQDDDDDAHSADMDTWNR